MTIQSAVSVNIAHAKETLFGKAADVGSGKAIRRVSSTLAAQKESFQSNEVREDLQVSDLRHGLRSARGAIEGEISLQTYDDWFEALFGGTWGTGVSTSPADFATGLTVATSGDTSTLTFAGTGNLLTKGFKVGDVIRLSGMTTTANNGKNLRVTNVTSTVLTVTPAITAQAQQATGWSVAVAGKKLLMGTEQSSFTIEQIYPEIDMSELFTGCRINSGQFRLPPNGMATVSFDILGQDGQLFTGAQSPYFTTIAAAPNTGVLAGLNGSLLIGGSEVGIVTALDLSITNNMSVNGVVGAAVSPDVFRGRKVATGNISIYLGDATYVQAFLNETELDLVTQLNTSSGSPQDFITLNMQRIKLSSISKTIAAEGGVIAQYGYQALLKSGGAGTKYDQSSVVMQRSNA